MNHQTLMGLKQTPVHLSQPRSSLTPFAILYSLPLRYLSPSCSSVLTLFACAILVAAVSLLVSSDPFFKTLHPQTTHLLPQRFVSSFVPRFSRLVLHLYMNPTLSTCKKTLLN